MPHGLIGKLLDHFKHVKLIHSQEDFIPTLFSSESYTVHSSTIASIVLYDYFPAGEKDAINNLFENKKKQYIESLNNFIAPLSSEQKITLNRFLLETIVETTTYGKKRTPHPDKADEWGEFDTTAKNRLMSYFKQKVTEPKTTPYNISLLIYFSVNKSIPPFFTYGERYWTDLEEFNDKVLCKYGAISEPGKRAIVELAIRRNRVGNIYAICEYADMLYYGDSSLGKPNYAEAIKYYEIAAGVRKAEGMETVCHPLALFSLSFIFYNYHRRGKLKDIPDIDYLEMFSDAERIELAINYARLSLDFLENGAAYNTLGVISEALSTDLLKKYNLKSARYYYEKAASNDYVYAYNNLATLEIQQIDTDSEHEMVHLTRGLEYLSHSADKYEPWSSNFLGKFYLLGELRGRKKIYKDMIDRNLAKNYFLRAIRYYIDRNSAWAAANLIVYFPEMYVDDKELLFSHIDICLTKGNDEILSFIAEVYSIDYAKYISKQQTNWELFRENFRDSIMHNVIK